MSNVPGGAAFFAAIRPLFGGSLSQPQVDGIKHILSMWTIYGDGDDGKLAYLLATVFHETAQTMQPVRETLAATDGQAIARLNAALAKGTLKKDYWSDGFFGRGYVQLTHRDNYERVGKLIGADLVGKPALALDPDIAGVILVKGCMEGWFTGKKLGDYINERASSYVNARRVVNGTDRAQLIADHAETFQQAIAADRAAPAVVVAPPPAAAPHTPGVMALLSLLAAVVALVLRLTGVWNG